MRKGLEGDQLVLRAPVVEEERAPIAIEIRVVAGPATPGLQDFRVRPKSIEPEPAWGAPPSMAKERPY